MELMIFKTLWGHQHSLEAAGLQAKQAGFNGIEGPAPESFLEREIFARLLADLDLKYIAEICTAGSYVPDRFASVEDHLQSLRVKLDQSLPLSPVKVTCLAGCDAWEEAASIDFFAAALELSANVGVEISFETHRGRSLFNPWVAQRICQQLPALRLTADFSHWCVVSERLIDDEKMVLDVVLDRVDHIHARVGYDQGAQVPDPRLKRYQPALQAHQRWWKEIWQLQKLRGNDYTTLTPEFGPDGYQMINPVDDQPVGDLWDINCWMAQQQRHQFEKFCKSV